jgi:serine/threonine protein kinase
MKLLVGRDLREVLGDIASGDESTCYPLMGLVDILIQACQTVGYAHAQGVIHRDLEVSL